jgi:hypothetical protein
MPSLMPSLTVPLRWRCVVGQSGHFTKGRTMGNINLANFHKCKTKTPPLKKIKELKK